MSNSGRNINHSNLRVLDDNFRLLISEGVNQLARTSAYIESFSEVLHGNIIERDDYIDNLKLTIENQCFTTLSRLGSEEKEKIAHLRARQIICVNLERIADYCVNICKQVDFLSNREFWRSFFPRPMSSLIEKSLNLVDQALTEGDIAKAMLICRSESELDEMFTQNFRKIMVFLREGKEVDTCVTILFIFRYLERMGDALLNIGEAILLAILGEKIKIRQFEALQHTLCHADIGIAPERLEVNSFWGNRSGCNISRIGGSQPGGAGEKRQEGLFKSGNREKIVRERNNIEKWTMIMPGLVPRVYSFHEDGNCSSMLVEFIAGETLESIIITRPLPQVVEVLRKLEDTLREVWKKSLL
ncbi:MAG: hypothetical protein JXR89_07930, partial [Deltaproteobacteria bacterium]|nr:hypothetical protein [Deltaproteobacteria bacterium]